jgi:hypothetical protein
MAWHLAQLNIAKMMYAPDSREMQDFNNALDTVNASAETKPGFVWRLESDPDESEGDLIFNDPGWLVNMSVWNELGSLLSFVRSDLHLAIMKRRREWFEPIDDATMVLWWIPAGQHPTVAEAQARLEWLRENGSSTFAFSFSQPYPSPE